ncbi:MAG: hypothetical protein JNM93_13890 [Bacteriovoracaceae bacterium]|nr:hypothetical protein [Bacteriovoracaceae bacterium]
MILLFRFLLLTEPALAHRIFIDHLAAHASEATIIENIFREQYSIPKEFIQKREVFVCNKTEDQSVLHLCVDQNEGFKILNIKEKILRKSFAIFSESI